MSGPLPRVRAFYRPSAVNGVAAAGARASQLDHPWRPTLLGPEIDEPTRNASPLSGCDGLACVTWPRKESVAAQVLRVARHIIEDGARVVVPNDLPHAFVAAALLEHRGVRCAAWIHSDHLDGEELIGRCGTLSHAWSAVTRGATAHAVRAAAEQGILLVAPCEPVWVCTHVPEEVRPLASAGPTRILYAGRIERMVKRTTDLVELIERLSLTGAEFQITIAGTGPAESWMRERLAGEIAAGRVVMPGAVPLALMGSLVDAHDAVILVSESEGMPNIVMEAFVRGRGAFLTAGCGGAAELVDASPSCGRVVPTGDMAAMARVVAATSRGELSRMGSAARGLASRFDICTISQRYNTLIITAGASAPMGPARVWAGVLRALTGIQGCTEQDVHALREWWYLDGGCNSAQLAEFGALLPHVPSPAERRLQAALHELKLAGRERVALYGAGAHTRKVSRVVEASECVRIIIDDRAGEPGGPPSRVLGRDVLPPAGLGGREIDAVVVSSDEYEREMLARARGFSQGIPVVGLYAERGPVTGS